MLVVLMLCLLAYLKNRKCIGPVYTFGIILTSINIIVTLLLLIIITSLDGDETQTVPTLIKYINIISMGFRIHNQTF